jgi:anthranilate phosphoribosyltransferase
MERGVKFCLVHGDDGYDEISLTGPTTLLTSTDWGRFLPIEEGFNTVDPDAIAGCVDSAKNATLIESILDGSDRSMRRDVVVANATRALMLAREGSTRDACRKEVEDALDCGKAFGVLNAVRNFVGDCK